MPGIGRKIFSAASDYDIDKPQKSHLPQAVEEHPAEHVKQSRLVQQMHAYCFFRLSSKCWISFSSSGDALWFPKACITSSVDEPPNKVSIILPSECFCVFSLLTARSEERR